MNQTFKTNKDVPAFFYRGDCEVAAMIPAGFRLQVFDDFGTDGDDSDENFDGEDDPDVDAGVWVYVQPHEQEWLPSEVGDFIDDPADDLAQLIVQPPEEILLYVKERFAEFSWMYDDPDEIDEELEYRARNKVEAQRDREAEVLWDIEAAEGRYSQAYLRQLRITPVSVALHCVTELAEFYDDDELRRAVRDHPDLEWRHAVDSGAQAAVRGAIERMLIAEVIAKPDSRQVDLSAAMGVDSSMIGSIAYDMAKAGFLDRRKEANRVVLSPGERCCEVGLDFRSAASLIAGRAKAVEEWATVMDGIPVPDPPTDFDLDLDYAEIERL